MNNPLLENNDVIFNEMMSHPALFMHAHPKNIIVTGTDSAGIVAEILKHPHVHDIQHFADSSIAHTKVKHHTDNFLTAAANIPENSIDIVISTTEIPAALFPILFSILHKNGIVMQSCHAPFAITTLKAFAHQFQAEGFGDLQLLHFPQPKLTLGWHSVFLVLKQGIFKHISEKAIFNKSFPTQYYNFDTHKAATAIPEFMREDWVN